MPARPISPGVVVIGVRDDGIIEHATDNVQAVLGWRLDQLVGRPLTTLIPRRFRRRHQEGFGRFVETGDLTLVGQPLRMPARHGDGGEVEVELVLSMPSRSDPACVVGVIRRVEDASTPMRIRIADELREAMAVDGPLSDVLVRCLELVGHDVGARSGTVWVHDSWTDDLRAIASWAAESTLGGDDVGQRSASAAGPAPPHVRSVFTSGASTWIDDVGTVESSASAGSDGAAAGYVALSDGSTPVGVIELLYRPDHDLTIEQQAALSFVGRELGRLVTMRIADDMVAADRQRVRLALDARGVATWSYRFPDGHMMGDHRLADLYGIARKSPDHVQRYLDLIVPEDRQPALDAANAAIERGERFEFRYRVRRPDGTMVWLEGAGAPISGTDGAAREVVGVCYDVSAEMAARRELEERARSSALSAEVGRAFVRDEPLADKLRRTTDAVVEHLDAAFARVWTLDEGSTTLVLRASSGMYTHLDGAHACIEVGQFKIGRIAEELEPHLTNDVLDDERISNPGWARAEGMRAFAGYPLVVGRRCVGVLAMFARHELPSNTLRALAAVADTVAIGIEQSRAAEQVMRLYGETHRNAATLESALRDRARVAHVLQSSLVPRSLPAIPRFRLQARYRAGVEEVGGDFYDVLRVGGDRWAFVLGDVCGRGPDAARLTALARHSLRMAVMLGHPPAQALVALNQALLQSDNEGRFCTAVTGVFFERPGGGAVMEIAVAGHPAPLLVRPDGDVTPVAARGVLLGVVPDATFTQTEVRLCPGDTLFAYTDGVVEARRGKEMFGVERLRDVASRRAADGAEALVDEVLDAVTAFDERASQDDLALLAIELLPE